MPRIPGRPALRTTAICGLIACTWSAPGVADTAYVIDRLLVGLYEQPDPDAARLGLYPTATPVETLETAGEFARVRTADGDEGWMKRLYLSDQAPAALVLKDKLRELEALRTRLAALEARATDDQAAGPGADEHAPRFDTLVRENTALKARVAELRLELMAERQSGEPRNGPLDLPDRQRLERLQLENAELAKRLERLVGDAPLWRRLMTPPALPWTMLTALLTFGGGGLGGIYLTDYLHRRRHGGFRI